MKTISINEQLRLYTKDQINPVNGETINAFLTKIQQNHTNFKTFLCLWYVDYVIVLRKSIARRIAKSKDIEQLQELLTIFNFDDLLAYIKIHPTFLETIIRNSIGFIDINDELRYNLLCLCDDLITFSPAHLLELIDLSKAVDLPNYIAKYPNDPKPLKYKLLVNSKSDFLSFVNNTIDMLREYYGCTKMLQYIGIHVGNMDAELLNLIENNKLETIINTLIRNDELFEFLISKFIEFQYNELPVTDDMIKNYYKTRVNSQIKTKLMRLQLM